RTATVRPRLPAVAAHIGPAPPPPITRTSYLTRVLPFPDLVPRLHPVAAFALHLERVHQRHSVATHELRRLIHRAEVNADGRGCFRFVRLYCLKILQGLPRAFLDHLTGAHRRNLPRGVT